jgi:WD40 repeat protein
MRLHRGVWAGACLLLALVGCSTGESDEVKGHGVYSPVITGIASNNEPVARGVPNQLTVQVTNVNNLPLTYHWSAASGTITDTTNVTATWTPLDSVATYNVTVSIEAHDGAAYFFKTLTVPMSVDNQYIRWTKSEQVQADPSPVPGGGVLYTGFHNPNTGSSDVFRTDAPLAAPIQLTSGFFSAAVPTVRADKVDFGFTGKLQSTETSPSIYLLPFGGGTAASARLVQGLGGVQHFLGFPWFARQGTRLMYSTDSTAVSISGFFNIHWIDGSLNFRPVAVIDTATFSFNFISSLRKTSWGPDLDADGDPDSVLALAHLFAGTPSEQVDAVYFFATPDAGDATTWKTWLSGAPMQDPDWSPDGQFVVFAKKNAGTNERDIWIIRRDTDNFNDAIRVTNGPADDSQPRFSEDGERIFFVSNRVDHYGANGIQGIERRGRNVWSVAEFDKP